jgi:hypothetical protein
MVVTKPGCCVVELVYWIFEQVSVGARGDPWAVPCDECRVLLECGEVIDVGSIYNRFSLSLVLPLLPVGVFHDMLVSSRSGPFSGESIRRQRVRE